MSRDAYLAVSQGGNLAASFGAYGTPMTIRRPRTGAMQRHDLYTSPEMRGDAALTRGDELAVARGKSGPADCNTMRRD